MSKNLSRNNLIVSLLPSVQKMVNLKLPQIISKLKGQRQQKCPLKSPTNNKFKKDLNPRTRENKLVKLSIGETP